MDESYDNENNERIYESIAECFQNNAENSNRMAAASTSGLRENQVFPPNIKANACYGFALPTISTATAKKALKTSADKLCDTVNTVCTKFGTLSQKLRRSTRRRAPLINSPGTPSRSLGRTPTKMYSPFSIETPRGKENISARRSLNRESFKKVTPPRAKGFLTRRKIYVEELTNVGASPRLVSDMQEAQIGIYELQHTANNILINLRQ